MAVGVSSTGSFRWCRAEAVSFLLLVTLALVAPASCKECTNIPSQPQTAAERERDYAMRELLLLAGPGGHSHSHDHPHPHHPETPDHFRMLMGRAGGDREAQAHLAEAHGLRENPGHGHGGAGTGSHWHWQGEDGHDGHNHGHGHGHGHRGEAGAGLEESTSEDESADADVPGVAAADHLLSPWHRGLSASEKGSLRKLIRRERVRRNRSRHAHPAGVSRDARGRAGEHQLPFLNDIPLHHVRLLPGSAQYTAQETNLKYLLMLDPDRLLWSFRRTAGLPAPGTPYTGWESPESELRGHFVGHFLSATALAWASTGNASVKVVMEYMVNELHACQEALGTGYLSAFPSEFFDRFEAIEPVWAPYYTIHKIMAGLLDQYQLAGNLRALRMVTRMAEYFAARVDTVIQRYTIERHWQSLNEEFGGMNDILYKLHTVTGDSRHLRLAHLFDKPCFLGPLALGTDPLSGFHSNTHIPIVIGCQSRYEVTGDALYRGIAEYFMGIINGSHSFSSGGTSAFEFWKDPRRTGDQLAQEDQESCTTYNMLKVSRNLFRWTRKGAHADYYEKALVNGVLGIQRGSEPGVMIYMLPHGAGNSKARGYHGWGTPFASFWCCYGTGIESFAKLGDSIYYQRPVSAARPVPTLYVTQFVPSSVSWFAAGLEVTQLVAGPTSVSPALLVTVTVTEMVAERDDSSSPGAGGEEVSWKQPGDGASAYRETLSRGSDRQGRSLVSLTSVDPLTDVDRATAGASRGGGHWAMGSGAGGDRGSVAEIRIRMPGWMGQLGGQMGKGSRFRLRCRRGPGARGKRGACVRVPAGSGCAASVNGVAVDCPRPGGFLRLRRAWESGSVVRVKIPLAARSERIQDDRPMYSSLHSIFVGPYLLVGLTTSDNKLHYSFDPADPAKSLAPVPPSANQELVTLFGRGVQGAAFPAGNAHWVVSCGSGHDRVFLYGTPGEGTDGAAWATFRVLRGSTSSGASRRLRSGGVGEEAGRDGVREGEVWEEGEEVLFEPYHMPGHVLVLDPERQHLRVVALREAQEMVSLEGATGRPHVFLLQGSAPGGGSESGVSRLFSHRGAGAAEGSDSEGEEGEVGGAPRVVSLVLADSPAAPVTVTGDPSFHGQVHASEFVVGRGLAQYSPLSFVVKGMNQDFLLQPIAHVRDESYTSYFNVTKGKWTLRSIF